jgi:glutamine amidotransferase
MGRLMIDKNKRVGIVKYGMGNVYSVISALNYIGCTQVELVDNAHSLLSVDKLILPGVGSFKHGMNLLKEYGLVEPIKQYAVGEKKDLLGICLGMQLLFEQSCEGGDCEGLGIIKGEVVKFDDTNKKVPHMGFNHITPFLNSKLLAGFSNEKLDFYFTHSYRVGQTSDGTACYCNYGEDFVALIEKDNVFGVQFHPELSQKNGLQLLSNFLE